MTKKVGTMAFRRVSAAGRQEGVAGAIADAGLHDRAGSDPVEAERLVERFGDLSWKSALPIATVVMSIVVGVLTCGHLLVGA